MAQQSDSRLSDPDSKPTADAMTNMSGAVADKETGADGAAPYGTRSRNRNGNARPNYAEDKDIEMDNYDYYDKNQGEAPKKSSRLATTATSATTTTSTAANGGDMSGRVTAGGRKPLTGSAPGSDDSKMSASQANGTANGNGHAPAGASAPSSSAASRKRKAVNGPAAQSAATATATATNGGQSARRVASSNGTQSAQAAVLPETNMLSFENCKARPQNGRLVADDGTVLEANDHVYLVCEPPGEPYYLGRIMEFLHPQNDPSRPVDAVRINWFYRPKDIGRKVTDTRLVIATMHSDISPLAALRGKCQIRHRAEIDHFDEYRKSPDCFWFEKLYDRYIQKHYDLIPTRLIVNVPDQVKKVLDERWKFVLVEQGRGKELTSAVKSCKRCTGYCASTCTTTANTTTTTNQQAAAIHMSPTPEAPTRLSWSSPSFLGFVVPLLPLCLAQGPVFPCYQSVPFPLAPPLHVSTLRPWANLGSPKQTQPQPAVGSGSGSPAHPYPQWLASLARRLSLARKCLPGLPAGSPLIRHLSFANPPSTMTEPTPCCRPHQATYQERQPSAHHVHAIGIPARTTRCLLTRHAIITNTHGSIPITTIHQKAVSQHPETHGRSHCFVFNDSVDCAVCHFTYHMNCVRPPLLKKPSRGFGWSCAACSRAQERKLSNRLTLPDDDEDEDLLDEDEEDAQDPNTNRTTPVDDDKVHHEGTAEQKYHASLWPYRYLGIHCKPEDALDYDDRIYPRAATRLGPRNQATVLPWPGQPVEYVKPLEIKRGKGGTKLKDIQEEKAMRGKRPKWVQDEPPGYTARGEDYDANDPNCTAIPLWIPPADKDQTSTEDVIAYMDEARETAKTHGLPKQCTNLQDVAINDLYRQEYNPDKALAMLAKTPMPDFKEPRLSPAEEKRWEEAISKYGSELFLVKKHVKTMTPGQVVRYYYTWKKSERGKQIWGNYSARKGKKQAKRAEVATHKMADDVADNDDDSAFDTAKAAEKKRTFTCLFCRTTSSRQWRRAPNSMQSLLGENAAGKPLAKDKSSQPLVALCRRCAELWRRYGVAWEDIDEVAKKVAQNGKTYKRKQDEELLKELQAAQEHGLVTPDRDSTPLSGTTSANGIEPPRKRLKVPIDRDFEPANSDAGSASGASLTKKKDKDRTTEATPVPELPRARTLPCAICNEMEPLGDQHVACRECRLTVHRSCYGIMDSRTKGKWLCDMCTNDKNPQVSIHYKCVLCPIEHTEQEFVEQPKLTHHKKKMSEKDRERERLEVQQARRAAEHYRKRQEELSRPVNPREPLKRTADNNWVHVTCAVWTPEVKFGNSKAMEPSEGITSIPKARYDEICHACNQGGSGACISCHHCRTTFHVECARQAGHLLAFDITPVKSTRRDQFNIVTINGESGTMTAMMWCKDHLPTKTIAHRMHEIVNEEGLNALQLYVQNFKQADLTLTGTVRRANLLTMAAKVGGAANPATRRISSTTANGAGVFGVSGTASSEHANPATNAAEPGEKVCISCGCDVTPRWWPIDTSQERQLTNGHYGAIGSEAQKFVEQRKFQCHKCKKLAKTPRPHHAPAPLSTPESRTPYPTLIPPLMPARRSPPPPVPMVPEYRDPRSVSQWPRPPSSQHHGHHGPPSPVPPLLPVPPTPSLLTGRTRPSHHSSHAFPAPPAPSRGGHYDWHPGAPPRHSPPPRHLSGGPPPMHSAPPPPISSLRPPPLSGPPPPVGLGSRHSPVPMYSSGLPPSPRSLRGPPPPTAPAYVPQFQGLGGHASHASLHGLNGGPPPLPPPRDSFAHGLHPQRSQYHSSVHVSPSGPANGMASHTPRDAMPSRPDVRPSGASANPSLRNLLS